MRLRFVAAGLAIVLVVPGVSLAGPGKAGLWEVSTQMGGMPQIPPEDLAKMRAAGVNVPMNNIFTTQHCVTPEEAAATKPPPMGHDKECQMGKFNVAGGSVSGDMTCSGAEMKGSGHFQINYDTPQHYSGQMVFSGDTHGQHMNMTNKFEGHWLSASCGNVTH